MASTFLLLEGVREPLYVYIGVRVKDKGVEGAC